ncbi:MAG: biopolymer transporter ExbD [Victivallaceae bacterium]
MKKEFKESFHCRLRELHGLPNLTPMVDVFFLLLIFFMLSSSFIQISGIKVDLPTSENNSSLGLEKFIVTIARAGNENLIYFKDKPVNIEMLKQEFANLSNLSNSSSIIIRPDKNVPVGVYIEIMSLASQAGLSSFTVAMPNRSAETNFENLNEKQ